MTKNNILLTEFVRQAISRTIITPYLNLAGDLPAYFLESELEKTIENAIENGELSSHMTLSPQVIRSLIDRVTKAVPTGDSSFVLLVNSGVRYFLRQLTENALPALSVIAHNEVPSGVRVLCLGTIK